MKGNHRHEIDGLWLQQAPAFKAAVMPRQAPSLPLLSKALNSLSANAENESLILLLSGHL